MVIRWWVEFVLKSIAAVVVGGTALTGGTGGSVNTLFGGLLLSVLDNGMHVLGIDPYFSAKHSRGHDHYQCRADL